MSKKIKQYFFERQTIFKKGGFTIVETLIVLGVTGLLFVSVSTLISGQIEKYRYRDAMYATQQQLRQLIKSTDNGSIGENTKWSYSGAGDTNGCTKKAGIPEQADPEHTGLSEDCTITGITIKFDTVSQKLQWAVLGKKTPGDFFNATTGGAWNNIELPGAIKVKNGAAISPFSISYSQPNLTEGSYTGTESLTPQSIGVFSGNPIGVSNLSPVNVNGIKICLEGNSTGSLVIGRSGNKDIELNMVDTC